MAAVIIDGRAIAAKIRQRLTTEVRRLGPHARPPRLAAVLVGNDPASQVYVASKVKQARECDFHSVEVRMPADAHEDDVLRQVVALNSDPDIDGILIQLPLPNHISSRHIVAAIDPEKDVDGLTEVGAGRLALGYPGLRPCTPKGCVYLATSVHSHLAGAHVVVVGRSILVGRPVAQLFLVNDCTVTLTHSKSYDLPTLCRSADILVTAIGKPEFVRGDWIRPGCTIIDVGINRVGTSPTSKGRLVGDVAFNEASEVAGAITPVPGGVGPMTIACLLENTLEAYHIRKSRKWL